MMEATRCHTAVLLLCHDINARLSYARFQTPFLLLRLMTSMNICELHSQGLCLGFLFLSYLDNTIYCYNGIIYLMAIDLGAFEKCFDNREVKYFQHREALRNVSYLQLSVNLLTVEGEPLC